MSVNLYRYTERCDGIPCPMDCDKCGRDDELYWELLEEQHAHDVVISGAMEGSEEDEGSDRKTGGDCSRRAVKSVWARGHDGVGQ